jgi:cinnamyl-alcohol dehydrogenase
VIKIGSSVKKFKIGEIAGVGPICGSCGTCSNCSKGWESYCPKVSTYNSQDYDGSITYGGYSNNTVVNENYAIIIPKGLPLEGAAPLLCAGLTVYSPMMHHGLCQSGQHLGIVGLGGLGHVAVKFAKAFNMKVTVISTSPGKKEEALERLGADSFLLINDQQQVQVIRI